MSISIIDHELPYDTHNTYDVVFFGESIFTTVTNDPPTVDQWISDVKSSSTTTPTLIVGLDVEWRPTFNRNQANPAATLQLCVGKKCLIFQLIYAPSIPNSLIEFLSNHSHTFVGVGLKADLEKLEEDYGFGFRTNAVDLRGLAVSVYGKKELKSSGIKELARVVLDKDINKPKRVTMSRWDYQWLKPDQVQYACVDAYLSFEIGRVLMTSSSAASPPLMTSSAAAPLN